MYELLISLIDCNLWMHLQKTIVSLLYTSHTLEQILNTPVLGNETGDVFSDGYGSMEPGLLLSLREPSTLSL